MEYSVSNHPKFLTALNTLHKYLPDKFPFVKIEECTEKEVFFSIGNQVFRTELGETDQSVGDITLVEDSNRPVDYIDPKILTVLNIIKDYTEERKQNFKVAGLTLKFEPKQFVDWYYGRLKKKEIRDILSALGVPKVNIDDCLRSRSMDGYKKLRRQRRYIIKDPHHAKEILKVFFEHLPLIYKGKFSHNTKDIEDWIKIDNRNTLLIKVLKTQWITIDKSGLIRAELVKNRLALESDFQFALLVEFAKRFKGNPSDLIIIGGIPMKFIIDDFVKEWSDLSNMRDMREVLKAMKVKKNTIDTVLKNYRLKFRDKGPWSI